LNTLKVRLSCHPVVGIMSSATLTTMSSHKFPIVEVTLFLRSVEIIPMKMLSI
jgi:hypothetical protein